MKTLSAMLFMTVFFALATSFSGDHIFISDTISNTVTDTIIRENKFIRQPDFLFPEQKKPSRIIVCNVNYGNPGEGMLAQSVSGLVAKAVNDGKYDALIWLNIKGRNGESRTSVNKWFEMTKSRLNISNVDTVSLWDIVDRLKLRGLINGYILFKEDESVGDAYNYPKFRLAINHSSNMATTASGILKGVMISEELNSEAVAHGLKELLDVRNETYATIYQKFKDKLNPNITMSVDPKYPNQRDMAVAFNSNVFFGSTWDDQFLPVINPGSPVLGWAENNEVFYTTKVSNYGLFNTASNWCDNLLVTSADAHKYQSKKIKTLDPKTINFSMPGSFYSFIMSDGDNFQWMERSFFLDKRYWANPSHGDFPIGWTSCLSSLSEMIPDALDYMASTQPNNSSVIEAEGGYNYVDQFGLLTPDRQKTVRDFAKKLNVHMKKTGARVLELFCLDLNSQAAKEAYQIYAEEIENLIGMIVLEFSPGYEGGNGEVFWPMNKEGTNIPVVSSKFCLWDRFSSMDSLPASYTRAGGPARLAKIINADANAAQQNGTQSIEWTVAMAWSESTENGVTTQGLTPVSWCVDKLNSNVNIISPEELLWRIRMKHDPDKTREIINK